MDVVFFFFNGKKMNLVDTTSTISGTKAELRVWEGSFTVGCVQRFQHLILLLSY